MQRIEEAHGADVDDGTDGVVDDCDGFDVPDGDYDDNDDDGNVRASLCIENAKARTGRMCVRVYEGIVEMGLGTISKCVSVLRTCVFVRL